MESNFTTSHKSRLEEPKSKETDRTVTVIDT